MRANKCWTKQREHKVILQHVCHRILRHHAPAILENSTGWNNCIIEQTVQCQTAIKEHFLSFPIPLLPSLPLGKFTIIFCIKHQLFYLIYSNKTSSFTHQNIWASAGIERENENSISNWSICIYWSRISHRAKFITNPQKESHIYSKPSCSLLVALPLSRPTLITEVHKSCSLNQIINIWHKHWGLFFQNVSQKTLGKATLIIFLLNCNVISTNSASKSNNWSK